MKRNIEFKKIASERARVSRENLTVADIVKLLKENWRTLVGATIAVMIVAGIYAFMQPNLYRSHASILPSGSSDKTASLRALAGLGGGSDDENSSTLFPIILRSASIAEAVMSKPYVALEDSEYEDSSLYEYFGTNDRTRLAELLHSVMTIDTDKSSGLIELSVETTIPSLSQEIAANLLSELNEYNIERRQSEARRRSEYLDRELTTKSLELATAEQALQDFQAVNRNWRTGSDPELQRELKALMRQAEIKSGIYAYLSQEYETARLDAQKDIPVVRVLDKPSLPTTKSGPRRVLTILMAGFAALMLGGGLLVVKKTFSSHNTGWSTENSDSETTSKSVSNPRIEVGKFISTQE